MDATDLGNRRTLDARRMTTFALGTLATLLFGCAAGPSPSDGGGGLQPLDGGAGQPDGGSVQTDGGAGTPALDGGTGAPTTYGDAFEGGQFHLGPVDWEETVWHNACAPDPVYAPSVQALEGRLLAGLWNGIPGVAGYCDACIAVTTGRGKSALLRVVTYGDTSRNSVDVSPEAFAALDSGEYPRTMTWRFAKCPDTGPLVYEFQRDASEWWTSLWVRNARVPLREVAVKGARHADFVVLSRGSDGSLTEARGFGHGPFTLRVTGIDGQQLTDTFQWPSGGVGSLMLQGAGNFR